MQRRIEKQVGQREKLNSNTDHDSLGQPLGCSGEGVWPWGGRSLQLRQSSEGPTVPAGATHFRHLGQQSFAKEVLAALHSIHYREAPLRAHPSSLPPFLLSLLPCIQQIFIEHLPSARYSLVEKLSLNKIVHVIYLKSVK